MSPSWRAAPGLVPFRVTLDAASPGEMKSGGAGIEIKYGFAATPFGEALIGETSRGISHLSFVDGQGRNGARDLLASQWPDAKLHRIDQRAKELSATIFAQPQINRVRSCPRL